MKSLKLLAVGTALATSAFATGCVDQEEITGPMTVETTRQQAVEVVPQFRISGVDAVPNNLYLSELGLVVSEIRLTPVLLTDSNLAYSTVDPMALKFDVSENETVLQGPPLELPDSGRYVVSIRLEPVETLEGEAAESSFSMDGFVAETPEPYDLSETSDGKPLPLPFDEKPDSDELTDAADSPLLWTPFQYNSRRSVFFTFNDVSFESGEQILEFTFDVRDWADGVADPISKAVRNSATSESDGIDVTRQIESTGVGVDALISGGVVRAAPRPDKP